MAVALPPDGGLMASDARVHTPRNWLERHAGRMLAHIGARGARYQVSIDPFVQQSSGLVANGENGQGRFGFSVALSSDGTTALIGAVSEDGGVGAAWVFTRSGSTWTEQAELTGGEEIGIGEFGHSVALSSDGNTALIGGEDDNKGAGAAWVFTRTGARWTQQAKLTGGEEESAAGSFGWSVALSSDGDTAMIGALSDKSYVGAAWVFTRSGVRWTQQAKLTGGEEETGKGSFGESVALSSDGNTALIGADGDSKGVGAAWVFTRTGSAWAEQARLTGGGEVGEGTFGASVALSSDGNTALVGGGSEEGGAGAAWVFTRTGATWAEQAKLAGSGEIGEDSFGRSVALSADGNTALIGGFGDNASAGAAWVFTRSEATWSQQGMKLAGSGEIGEGYFGWSVALSSDASTALIGSPNDNGDVGTAAAFVNPPPGDVVGLEPIYAGQTNRVWREGTAQAGFARRHRGLPIGTTFSLTVDEQASMRLAFTQQVGGRRRAITRGVISFTGHAGTNRLFFAGRISRSKMLPPGRYTLVITARSAVGGHSSSKRLSFTIVR